jgi:biotin carboxyl carrier protein
VQVEEVAAGAASAPVAVASVTAPSAPAAAVPAGGGVKVTAPMPGNILGVRVSAGQTVAKGDILVILEAMKMENEIMAPSDGTVAGVHVNKGDPVETGALLISFS